MLKIVLCVTLSIFVVFCFCYVAPLLHTKPLQQQEYRGVIDLWHVETFEGGSQNRQKWLNNVVRTFEKAHKGVYVCVATYTHQQAVEKLEAGQSFDVISFSVGTGNALLPHLAPLEVATQDVLDGFVDAGRVRGTQYALCYSTGFYALFARQKHLDSLGVTNLAADALNCNLDVKIGKNVVKLQPVGCGFGAFNNPTRALPELRCDRLLTQYQAYEQFVGGKGFVVLLGTQRDAYRLTNRVQQGKMEDLAFCVLPTYTDLAQYLGISSSAGEKSEACRQLVGYLTSKEVQHSLCNVYLLSPTDLEVYGEGWMRQAQDALPTMSTPNVFIDVALLSGEYQGGAG
ncbi:MAG: hypothetical protein IKC47_03110 [Clostridia bacterium]|nr:hypothetical protein [Clostridia bacterium]